LRPSERQLTVTISPPQLTGQKAVIRLGLKNEFKEKIASARAVVFLLDEKGKMVAQGTRWIVGGGKGRPGLEPSFLPALGHSPLRTFF